MSSFDFDVLTGPNMTELKAAALRDKQAESTVKPAEQKQPVDVRADRDKVPG